MDTPVPGWNEDDLRRRITEVGPWFHPLDLCGVNTGDVAPNEAHISAERETRRWAVIGAALPEDLAGWRILDLGCLDGFYTVQLAARGADVVAMDSWGKAIARVELVKEVLGLDGVETRLGSVYDLDSQYDVVLMLGLIYMLDHPMLALERVAGVTGRLIISSGVDPGDERPLLEMKEAPSGDIHWVPTCSALRRMVQLAGFEEVEVLPLEEETHVILDASKI